MRARFRHEARGERKLERSADGLWEEVGILEREEFDFLGRGDGLGRFLFLFFGFLDRVAQLAGVVAVEGFFRAGENRAVLCGVGPDHVCPGHGLKDSPVASDDKKQRNGGYDLAAGCEDFSTECGHGRGDWSAQGDDVKSKKSGRFLAVAPVFGEFVAEGADADLEEFRSLGAVAVCAIEGFENGSLFEFVKGHDLRIRGGRGRLLN